MDFSINISWKQVFDKKLAKELKTAADRKWELKITGKDQEKDSPSATGTEADVFDKIPQASLSPDKMALLEERLMGGW